MQENTKQPFKQQASMQENTKQPFKQQESMQENTKQTFKEQASSKIIRNNLLNNKHQCKII